MRREMDQDRSMVPQAGLPLSFEVPLDPQAPLFVIGVVSEMTGLPVWTLRKLDLLGVVSPRRVGVRTRCYSQVQITRLRYARYLMEEKRVNISAVKVVLEMREP